MYSRVLGAGQGVAMERCIHDVKLHWGDGRYKKMLIALLLCQQTLMIVGEQTWVVFPLQRAYGMSVSGSVSVPKIETDMMNLMRMNLDGTFD